MRALCYLLCVVFLAPFATLAVIALWSPEWSLTPIELKSALRSLLSGLAAALATAALGAALAYQVCFHHFPFRRLVEKLLVLPLLFPTFVLGSVYRELFAASGALTRITHFPAALTLDLESTAGFVFIMCIGLFPYVYLLCRISFESHGRAALELGQSAGLSLARSFTKILLPLCLPAVLLGAALVLVETTGEWATASLLSVNTSAVAVHDLWFVRGAPGLASQLAFLFVVVALIALVPISRWLTKQRARYLTAVPADPPRVRQGDERWRVQWTRFTVCFVPALLGFVIPAVTVGVFFARTIDVIDLSALLANCVSTIALLAAVSLMCLSFALVLSATHSSSSGLVTGFVVRWLTISYAVPATVLAVGSLILADRTFFFVERYDDLTSFFILALTLSIRFVFFLLVPLHIGLSFVSQQVEEVGASLGLSRTQAFFRLHLPQIRGFVLVGLMLLVLQISKETAISVVLHPFSFQTLVLKAYAYINIDLLPESSAWIIATALLGLYPLLTIESMLSRRGAVRS
jgi:iron(III) transport system permease protein